MLSDIDEDANNEEVTDKTFDVETDFQHIDFKNLSHATIHFELEDTNYLKDNILKFGLYTDDTHIVINAEDIKQHSDLIEWLEDAQTVKTVYDAKKTYVAAHRLDINIQNVQFDVMLASYIIDPSRAIDDVKSVLSLYGQNYVKDNVSIYGKGKNIIFQKTIF